VAKSFTSENDLQTFEGWLDYQGIDHSTLTAAELEMWRETYADVRRCADATPKVGKMKLKHGEHRYAVAVREGSDLWLTTWIRRSPKGDVYVLTPRGDRGWNPHASYHRDGTFHMKSHGQKFGAAQKRQPLTGAPPFKGTEHLGAHMGHGPKSVGAVCDPADFPGIVELEPGVLGPRDGQFVVDLVEPGCKPMSWPGKVVRQEVFRDVEPWLVIRIVA
jgi:hypothetical protein